MQKVFLGFLHQYTSGISKNGTSVWTWDAVFQKSVPCLECCKGKKLFSKTKKLFTLLHRIPNIKQKTSQARYNPTRFADFNVPRHSVFSIRPNGFPHKVNSLNDKSKAIGRIYLKFHISVTSSTKQRNCPKTAPDRRENRAPVTDAVSACGYRATQTRR